MKSVCTLGAFLVAFILGQVACHAQPAIGSKPTLSFTAHDGTKVDLADLRGKLVLIDFWASWCGPCMAEAEHMRKINASWGPQGVVLIGINMDTSTSAMNAACRRNRFTWPQYYDGQGWNNRIAKAWGVRSIPALFLIAPDGTLIWKGHPANVDVELAKASYEYAAELLDPAVKEAAQAALQEAENLIGQSKFAEAVKALSRIDPLTRHDKEFAALVHKTQEKLLEQGQKSLEEIDALVEQSQFTQALEQLNELHRAFQGTKIMPQVYKRHEELTSRPDVKAALADSERQEKAAAALAQADKLRADGKHIEAYQRYMAIVQDHDGTEAARTAATAVADYEKDAAFVKAVRDQSIGAKAQSAMSMADSYARSGKIAEARKRYEQIIAEYPDTTWAEQARQALAKLPK